MKVKDIISRIVDNYYKIVIETFDSETNLIKDRYVIKPHSFDFLDTEVGIIVVHFDSLVIAVEEGSD